MKKQYIVSIIGFVILCVYNTMIEITSIQISSLPITLLVFIISLIPFELLFFTLSRDEKVNVVIRKIAIFLFWFFLFASALSVFGKIMIAIKSI